MRPNPLWLGLAALLVASLAGCVNKPSSQTDQQAPVWKDIVKNASKQTFYHFSEAKRLKPNASIDGDNVPFPALGGYVGIGASTFEPTIGSTKSGALFMTSLRRQPISPSPDSVDQGTRIYRGTDHGSAWKDVGPFLGPTQFTLVPNSNDPFLYVDPWTNRIINFDMCLTLSGFCMSVSDDDGNTWKPINVVTGQSGALDHQSIASAPPVAGVTTSGYANVLVFCVNRGTTITGAWCSTSRDGGVAWTPLAPGFPASTTQCSGLHGHVRGAADGRFYRGNPACSDTQAAPAVYRSDDSGITWSQHIIPGGKPVLGHDVAVDVDTGGRLYAFWIGDDGLPYLAASMDRGETWSKPRMVAPPGVTATGFPAVVGGEDGRVAFGYIGTTEDDGYDGVTSTSTWNGYLGVITDAGAENPLITTVLVNDPVDDPLSKGQCGDRRCGGFGDFIGITIDVEGRPWVAMANNEKDGAGIVGTLAEGPALRGPLAPLPALALPSAGGATG